MVIITEILTKMQFHWQGDSLQDETLTICTVLLSVWNRQTKARKGFPLLPHFNMQLFYHLLYIIKSTLAYLYHDFLKFLCVCVTFARGKK